MSDRDTSSMLADSALLRDLTGLAALAAAAIMRVRCASAPVRYKADASPATDADDAAETIILEGLTRILPGVPVITEERGITGAFPQPVFILVDPLDGTREFIAGRGEFTVNLAIVVEGRPRLGVVAAPALEAVWRGSAGAGAERLTFRDNVLGPPAPITARRWPAQEPVAIVSRSHLDARTQALIARIPDVVQEACGSALKFCRLAEGHADLYPRLAPTREWDIAAGHALLDAAGGAVFTPDGAPPVYGNSTAEFLVPAFIAAADAEAAYRLLALP